MSRSKRSRAMHRALLLVCLMLAACLSPVAAYAQDPQQIVRVGWFESPFNTTDERGRRSGYSYDYQQKIAAYTGWTYEYVQGSWPELLQMLEDGRIDLLSDVSYTDERAERLLYASLPMGAEEYYLFAAPDNQSVRSDDLATFDGKRIGVNKGSVQLGLFREWAQANGVEAQVVELTGSEEENVTALRRGKIDLYLSLDGFFDSDLVVPVCQIGSSDVYFAVSSSRPELLPELNNAMNRVFEENPQYNQELYAEYLQTSGLTRYLNSKEVLWLYDHGTIRVGYQDNYLAFCAADPETGELTGALRDYLDVAADCLENAHLDFEPVCYPTAADAMEALENGEVDCVFPTNLTAYDGEMRGVFVTPAIMCTDMTAVIRAADRRTFGKKDRVTVAVNADNPNYDMFLLDHFPEWRAIYFADTAECLKAVADGQADCLLVSSYRYNNIAKLCDKYNLTTWSTGVEMDYCFAVNREDTLLYSILAKTAGVVPRSTVNAALTYYFTEDARVDEADPLTERLLKVDMVVAVLAVTLLALLLVRRTKRKKLASDEEARREPTRRDFELFDEVPLSYSVYRVTHLEHSELYDAEIVYANDAFVRNGRLSDANVAGHRVRELFPYVEEEWFRTVKRAAIDGETVEYDYVDPLHGKTYHFQARQVFCPGYCAVTYTEV